MTHFFLKTLLPVFILTCSLASAQLPVDPDDWLCSSNDITEKQIQTLSKQWCEAQSSNLDLAWRKKVNLPAEPAQLTNLVAKNIYDKALRTFLRERQYDALLNWPSDQKWRLTGPYVGEPFGSGNSYGVHPAVRVFYSPEVVKWMCGGRQGAIPNGSLIIKEMVDIDQDLGIVKPDNCMSIPDDEQRRPSSWTVMVRSDQTHDGWYWANPTAEGDGNPPVLDKSAFVLPSAVPGGRVKRNPDWYPTGYLFPPITLPDGNSKISDVVYPYNLYGGACINCHATAESELTFSSLDNIVSPGLQYKWYPETKSSTKLAILHDSRHSPAMVELAEIKAASSDNYQSPFSQPLASTNKAFSKYYGDLGINNFAEAWKLRFPAETFDHHLSAKDDLDQYLTSDQCINCHDATYANSAEANMLIDKKGTDLKINVSPYAEWRVSPMGLAGRDPIFFSQLQSETNNLSAKTRCIENTCLHCHGVMGQRQQAIDTKPSDECKDIFAVLPPDNVPFGKPFAKETVTKWQNTPNDHDAKYGALARDGISCLVCHQMNDTDFGQQPSFTGNFVTNDPGTVVGPYRSDSIIPKPMENALGITPEFGEQVSNSDMCGTCHNILLPTFNNDGTNYSHTAPDGQKVKSTYEQTTHLEWVNSDYSKKETLQSCQDCHMPTDFNVGSTHNPLQNMKIANIESSDFAPTTHRLPNKDISLTERENYPRHALHGLNVFLNEMFQQFPMLLGLRQMDYMVNSNVQPALITGRDSMLEMARNQTASVVIKNLSLNQSNVLNADIEITNKTGHYLPSGVGFRRLFLEFIVYDKKGNPIWASGRTNELGVIVDGLSNDPLPSENGGKGSTAYQPHYQTITRQNQVQIYQELIKDSDGHLTTSFLRRITDVKDNRIRGKGFDPKFFLDNPSPYIQILGELTGEAAKDPDYYDPNLTGADKISYKIAFDKVTAANIGSITIKIVNQSIPPAYLQDRFSDATVGAAKKDDIQRLYYITSHLNTGSKTAEGGNVIQSWKIYITGRCQQLSGANCASK